MGNFDYVPDRFASGGYIKIPAPTDPRHEPEYLANMLAMTQSQLYQEITQRQALESRVDELEALVKQLAKKELGLDIE